MRTLRKLFHQVHPALAGVVAPPTALGGVTPNENVGDNIVTQLCRVADWIFMGAIIIAIIFALLAAIEYMRSAGDPAKVKTATNRLVWAAIGVAVALIAFLFPGMIASILSAQGFKNAC